MSSSLPEYLTSLLDPAAYPHPVRSVELVETHISWVLLTGELAYKLKRPVHYPFVDLRSLERRAYFCAEEVRLNRRFCEPLYLDVCPITRLDGRLSFGGSGEVIEHAVRMRQFNRSDELDRLLSSNSIAPEELTELGSSLALVHSGLPTPAPEQVLGSAEATAATVRGNLDECLDAAKPLRTAADVDALRASLAAHAAELMPLLETRFAAGRVRECHGDLHSRNVVRHQGKLVAFDCLEFAPALRWIDVADEIAFLYVDLRRQGYAAHAHAFLGGYLGQSGDYEAVRLLRLFQTHRALVRAKTAALGASVATSARVREDAAREHSSWLAAARAALLPERPALVLVAGLSGSGKTWLAGRLAGELSADLVRSDVERKRLLGLAELDRTGSELGSLAYSPEVNAQVQKRLTDCAEAVLSSGRAALVDATLLRREDRVALRALGARYGIPVQLVHCHAPREVLLQRIASRAAQGNDASEANAQVLAWQENRLETVGADEGFDIIEADTTRPDVATEVLGALSRSL
jgi:aminoglycoside phosphotransferase family enzyme/predicted kinase